MISGSSFMVVVVYWFVTPVRFELTFSDPVTVHPLEEGADYGAHSTVLVTIDS